MWRPDNPDNPDNYQLVCDNAVNALETGLNEFDIPDAEQCTFLANDAIGWSQPGSGVISYTTDAEDGDEIRYR